MQGPWRYATLLSLLFYGTQHTSPGMAQPLFRAHSATLELSASSRLPLVMVFYHNNRKITKTLNTQKKGRMIKREERKKERKKEQSILH